MKNAVFVLLACLALVGAAWGAGFKLKDIGGNPGTQVMQADRGNDGGVAVPAGGNGRGNSILQGYNDAKEKYQQSLKNWKEKRNDSKDRGLQVGKDYTGNAIALLKRTLEFTSNEVSKTRGLSAGQKAEFDRELQTQEGSLDMDWSAVQNSTNMSDLFEHGKDIKAHWQQAQGMARSIIGAVGINKIDGAITAGWKAANTTEGIIAKCNQASFDVGSANADLASFENDLSLASQDNILAKADFNASNATAGFQELKDAQAHLIDAKKYGPELKNDLKECVVKHGYVGLAGTGWLQASGTGRAEISGNGTVSANFSNGGNVTVFDRAGDALISVSGGQVATNQANSTNATVNYVTVRTFTGVDSVAVSGSRFTVVLKGQMNLSASGTGIAMLAGTGIYEYGTNENSTANTGTWSENGAAVRISGRGGQGED